MLFGILGILIPKSLTLAKVKSMVEIFEEDFNVVDVFEDGMVFEEISKLDLESNSGEYFFLDLNLESESSDFLDLDLESKLEDFLYLDFGSNSTLDSSPFGLSESKDFDPRFGIVRAMLFLVFLMFLVFLVFLVFLFLVFLAFFVFVAVA